MLTISKPLSAGQASRYHAEEFGNGRDNYYTAGERIRGSWHGRLGTAWGLRGDVHETAFARLAEGAHPTTGEQLVRHQTAHQSRNAHGDLVTTREHRAGWDLTFSAPKSVSITALVGGDLRVREAHKASVSIALDETEAFVEARLGGNRPAETTGRWIAARFEHDSARPVDGYAAPQLHTHVVVFNVTQTETHDTRPLQPRELFKTQPYATAVYRAELAHRLIGLGYDVDVGRSGQPEIRGYTDAYLEASSRRRQQIEAHLAATDHHGAAAAQIAAHRTREAKIARSPEEVREQHQAVAHRFGDQPALVISAAEERSLARTWTPPPNRVTAQQAVTFAKERGFEREAVIDSRVLLRDALTRAMGELTIEPVKTNLEQRTTQGEFLIVAGSDGSVGHALTTREIVTIERETMARMRAGQDRHPRLVSPRAADLIERDARSLNPGQRAALRHVFESRDTIFALDGVAGSGKTTALTAVREAVRHDGFTVHGVAPTSRAAQVLADAGFTTNTLQHHLAMPVRADDGRRHLYILDEASLAGTRQLHRFFSGLTPADRVLLVGDVRQHEAVEAGRPYWQLQHAGIRVAHLDHIVRQQNPVLREVVTLMARGDVDDALRALRADGHVVQIPDRAERLQAIATEYVRDPHGTLIVAPDHQTRRDLNDLVHRSLQTAAALDRHDALMAVLVARQDLTGADRQWAHRYQPGDVIRYARGSQTYRLSAGSYATVEHVDAAANLICIAADHGSITYDPRRLQGVTVYQVDYVRLARGDRLQLTAPDRARHLANRELGVIEGLDGDRHLDVRFDSGRRIRFRTEERLHLDYGYAVTSHSSQGQTSDRVLVHVDTAHSPMLVNRRFAYVATSRARYDARLYTDSEAALGHVLGRDTSHRSAIESPSNQHRHGVTLGHALSGR
jgi:conjugative relaxase-like TrwC/TraI family protein